MRRILFAASEVSPFSKTGGLSDVAGSLPKEVVSKTNNIRVISPLYRGIEEKYGSDLKYVGNFNSLVGWREQYTGIFSMKHNGVIHYFIDNKFYFDRDNLYGYDDDNERFAFFCRAILEALKFLDFKPDLIHCNDWQTAAIPVMLKDLSSYDEYFQPISTILTIHNLKFQGLTDRFSIGDLFNLPDEYYRDDLLKFYEDVNILKGGIICADKVTTVSPSYAEEIEYKYFGEKLHGVIHDYNYKLKGILNGLDYDSYNPETDEFIPNNFSIENIKSKKLNKEELQKSFGLPISKTTPMISMVTRLDSMKGLDLLEFILDELLQEDIQFVLLGTGDKKFEDMFRQFEAKYPQKLAARLYFSNEDAHKIYAASDIFLMPSNFEPCGLGQLIALRYGTIPIVREVGGLKDTIIHFDPDKKTGNGFRFTNYNAHELLFTVKEALYYYKKPRTWSVLVKNALASDYSWDKSSKEYIKLYRELSK